MMECGICGSQNEHTSYKVKENMFGLGEVFTYFQCGECGCLQITNPPEDMDKYYPKGYYSYGVPATKRDMIAGVKSIRDRLVVQGWLGQSTFVTNLVRPSLRAVAHLRLPKTSRIIDVGCGAGDLLKSLNHMGFKHLRGVDPYIEEDINYGDGFRVNRSSIEDIEGKWDVVMFHHSFEHIWEQEKTLKSVSALLDEGGACVIRVPTVSSYVWHHYKENWVQIDAPRHFYLHSVESMRVLAANSGFQVKSISYDSTAFQFWGSDLYTKGIALVSPDRSGLETRDACFSRDEITTFDVKAKQLNAADDGDQAVFVLRKM